MKIESRRERPLRRALAYARPHRFGIIMVACMTALVGACGALEPLVHKYVFDALSHGSVLGSLGVGLGGLAASALIREACAGLANWMTWRIRLRVHFELLGEVVERLQQLPANYHKREGVGAILTRLERGIQGFVGAVCDVLFHVLPSTAFLLVAITSMALLDVRLLAVVAALCPLPAVIAMLASPRQVTRERRLLRRWSKIYSRLNEVLSGIVTVRSFAREEEETRRFLARVAAANRIVERGVAFDTRVAGVQNLVGAGARVAVIAVGALLITRGEVTLGTIVAFMGYVGGVFGPIQTLTGVYGTVRRASAAMAEVFDVLDRQDHVIEHAGAKELSHVTGTVRFEGVHFSYDGRAPVLGGIDLTARAGEHIAIVGPSGGGKTTIMALLQRFHDPNQGRITIDGVNLVDLKRGSLRRNIAVVLQDPVLFNDTVAANIAYGRPGATRAEIESAARAAEAHEFVSALRGGYDALVGERGQLLSMGQRQRIAIARAILKHAPIVILDEATSALDSVSEAAIQQALRRLIQGRTTFTIAHRLATVVGADRIIVIRGGRISEEGPHAELVAQKGYYAQLVSHQLRGLLDDAA